MGPFLLTCALGFSQRFLVHLVDCVLIWCLGCIVLLFFLGLHLCFFQVCVVCAISCVYEGIHLLGSSSYQCGSIVLWPSPSSCFCQVFHLCTPCLGLVLSLRRSISGHL